MPDGNRRLRKIADAACTYQLAGKYSMPRRSLQRLFHHDDRLIHVRPDQFGKFIRQEIVDPD